MNRVAVRCTGLPLPPAADDPASLGLAIGRDMVERCGGELLEHDPNELVGWSALLPAEEKS